MGILEGMGGAIAGAGMGLILQRGQDRRNLNNARDMQKLQIEGAKEMGDYNKENQMEIWNRTNYAPQVEQLKKAGLNPALLYGGGGGGGATTGGTTGMMPSGGNPNGGDQGVSTVAGMGLQSGLMAAQIKVLESQARKNEVDANKAAGADTNLANVQADSIAQGINNQVAAEKLTKAQTRLAGLADILQSETIEAAISKIKSEAGIATSEARSALAGAKVDEATVSSKISILDRTAANLAVDILAKKSGIELNEAKVAEIVTGIQQKWRELEVKGTGQNLEHQDRVKAIEEFTSNALKVAGIQAAGQVVSDVVKIATRQLPLPNTGTNTTVNKYNGKGDYTGRIETITKPNP